MKGLFFCDSFRMAQEPVADVEIQCLAEPWSCVVSPPSHKACVFAQCRAGDAFLVRDVLLACIRCPSEQRARCSFVAEGGDGEAAGFREQPNTVRKHRGRETSPISRVVNPGRCGTWILLCRFLVSLLCQDAFLLAFPFFFPSLSLLARILTYITGW